MPQRNTTTGSVLEKMILPALRKGNYHYRRRVSLRHWLTGKKYIADVVAWYNTEKLFLVSLKWQQVSGTTEQKIPFEVISLTEIALNWNRETKKKIVCQKVGCNQEFILGSGLIKPYLVLGGPGWSLRDFYIKADFQKYLIHANVVKIITLEDFIAKANQRKL